MHLLDSDTVSHLWANHERVVDRLRRCEDAEIGTTSISKCEILRARCENLLNAATPQDVLNAQRRLDRSEQTTDNQEQRTKNKKTKNNNPTPRSNRTCP
jgi:tRNA(fMet)-specific endonuclease VapC